jgi:hypothetical protein
MQVTIVVFGSKSKLQIDLGGLNPQKEELSKFLQSKLKLEVTLIENKMLVDSEKTTPQELQRVITKFIYHHNLNNAHWVSVEGKNVKINNFKNAATKKQEKDKKTAPHASLTQSWGL